MSFWALSRLSARPPLQVTSLKPLSSWHSVYSLFSGGLSSMLVSPSQQMTTSPSASSTSSGGTNNSLTSSGQSHPCWDKRINKNKFNFRCVYHSTINLKWLGRSVLDGEYLGFILALILSVLSCALLTCDKIDRICHDFLQIQNNEAAVMKSANLLRYKPNWCAMPECWVQCSLAAF